jgi:chemotaxis protein methyltransferase WspC
MWQSRIEALIKQQTGIDVEIVGSGLIRSAIDRCLRSHQLTELSDYWQLLQSDSEALQQLIDKVVVPETWFFRDRKPFDFLAQQIQAQLKQKQLLSPLRILSVPCSTGEEPYSIAMALIQAGISSTQFKIDAIDISQHNIQQAQKAIYQRFSFRNEGAEALQAAFFDRVESSYHLQSRIKQLVNFQVGNILESQAWKQRQPYDAIFCRNLLIYFNQVTRQQVLQHLEQALKPTGILFVGHAESSLLLNAGWQGVQVPFTFAYRKASSPPLSIPQPPKQANAITTGNSTINLPTMTLPEPTHPPISTPPASTLPISTPPISTPPVSEPPINHLQKARQLADLGQLTEALQLCLQQIQSTPLQPELYLLLGQIYQAQKQDMMAETHFRKALYLQVDSIEALTHLARLKQQQGHTAAANRLFQRIERLQGYRLS